MYNINLIAKPTAKLKELVHRKIDPIPDNEISVVYIIHIKDNVKQKKLTYIGTTSRKFMDRLKDHTTDIKNNKPSTALSRFTEKLDIDIDFKSTQIIAHTSLYYTSIIRESLEILTKGRNTCNDILSYNIP